MHGKHTIGLILIITLIIQCFISANCCADVDISPYEIMPWKVGQYAVYQIVSMEGEDAGNRYTVSLVGREEINDQEYFWVTIDVWENVTSYGHNTIKRQSKKNVSFKALVPTLNTTRFIKDTPATIFYGVFPREAVLLSVQFEYGPWQSVNPQDFFNHQDIIEDTPYSLTPHAQGRIDFRKLKINSQPEEIITKAGKFLCHHFYVTTNANEDYWDEGFDLWRSNTVPILGLVKMEFSKTKYWEKWGYRNEGKDKKTWWQSLMGLYKKRISGRRRTDTCTMLLVAYGT